MILDTIKKTKKIALCAIFLEFLSGFFLSGWGLGRSHKKI